MALRTFVIFFCFCAVIAACSSDPQDVPLGVTSIIDHKFNKTQTFRYSDEKLYSYFSKSGSDTLALMRFYFNGEQLSHITMDSVDTADHVMKKTFIYNMGNNVVDSTFASEPDTTFLTAARAVTYDSEGHPLTVSLKTWTGNEETGEVVVTDELAELTWENGNILYLNVYDVLSGTKVRTTGFYLTYDNEKSIYMDNREYLYTLALDQLYWLSKNNATVFYDGSIEAGHVYDYNKLGYPSSYLDGTGAIVGMSYTQIR